MCFGNESRPLGIAVYVPVCDESAPCYAMLNHPWASLPFLCPYAAEGSQYTGHARVCARVGVCDLFSNCSYFNHALNTGSLLSPPDLFQIKLWFFKVCMCCSFTALVHVTDINSAISPYFITLHFPKCYINLFIFTAFYLLLCIFCKAFQANFQLLKKSFVMYALMSPADSVETRFAT